jgi:predicted nucleic acid-binding protein
MTDVVLDASVVLKWFHAEDEEHVEAARALRAAFETGTLVVYAPPLLNLEILNVAARRSGWDENRLTDLVESLGDLGFVVIDPDLSRVASWAARGLTAYDAAYVALAEAEGIRLVTDDSRITAVAPEIAAALVDAHHLVNARRGMNSRRRTDNEPS